MIICYNIIYYSLNFMSFLLRKLFNSIEIWLLNQVKHMSLNTFSNNCLPSSILIPRPSTWQLCNRSRPFNLLINPSSQCVCHYKVMVLIHHKRPTRLFHWNVIRHPCSGVYGSNYKTFGKGKTNKEHIKDAQEAVAQLIGVNPLLSILCDLKVMAKVRFPWVLSYRCMCLSLVVMVCIVVYH